MRDGAYKINWDALPLSKHVSRMGADIHPYTLDQTVEFGGRLENATDQGRASR